MKASDLCAPGQGCLIRHFDKEGKLLYVGRAMAINRPWKMSVAEITIERFATKNDATQAETLARASENPLYNAAVPDRLDDAS